MKKILLSMLIVLTIVGCNGIPSSNTFNQAQGKVIVDNQEYTMVIGEFEWLESDSEFRKISSSDINDLAEEFDTLQAEKNNKLIVEIEQNPTSIIVNQWNEDDTSTAVELKDNEITLPLKKGYYIYEVIVEWNNGKATYFFDVNIK
ncbi:hypothetical protein M3152_00660 [Sporosarcina luteola]|uniref:hypothetical protein n=1 Tax=Sporosarcina luteola TaxID=582850 RepID=UPI00204228CF|nr:hypothetical protein [Sporosarcina luteola]MCM3636211.1 hypothetical protein [Sporosarcina luteola]